MSTVYLISLCIHSLFTQLETKCLSQQEELDDLEEKLKEERQKTITTQEELNKKINEVRERGTWHQHVPPLSLSLPVIKGC